MMKVPSSSRPTEAMGRIENGSIRFSGAGADLKSILEFQNSRIFRIENGSIRFAGADLKSNK